VIVGNPPYSIGQESQNDNNQNVTYPSLDRRIEETYAARSDATLSKGLYDSYIRAIRWASDRIGNAGVIGFVTNGGFIEKAAMDGLRRCLIAEFSSLHVLNLRGDIRKNMLSKGKAKEGQNIFGSGSMAGIAISLLIKDPKSNAHGRINYHDIGDDVSRDGKLERVAAYASVAGIPADAWQTITPDEHGDWLRQRDNSFGRFMVLGDKKGDATKIFDNFSLGIVTNRDAWAYNQSKAKLAINMVSMVTFYNREVERFNAAHPGLDSKARQARVDGFVDADPARISWTVNLKQDLLRSR